MATNCPQQVVSGDELTGPVNQAAHEQEGFGAVVLDRIGQMFCGIHGHDHLMQFEDERIFLRCVSCGHQSPGWEVPRRRAALKFGQPTSLVESAAHAEPARRVA